MKKRPTGCDTRACGLLIVFLSINHSGKLSNK